MSKSTNYTTPVLCPKKPTEKDLHKTWYVWFRFQDPATLQWKKIKEKKGINYFKNFKERLSEAEALRDALIDNLKAGWNPITKQFEKRGDGDPLDQVNALSKMSFDKAVTYAIGSLKVSPRTKANYTNSVTRIMKQSTKVKIAGQLGTFDFSSIPIDAIKKKHIKILLQHCTQVFKWSNKAYNKNMEYFKAVLGRLSADEADIIEHNPALGIKYLPETESNKFVPYTEEEKKAIYEYFFLNHYSFFVYWMMIYYAGMRPNEILALQVGDVDLKNKMITIVPDEERDNSKTKTVRYIPLMDALFPLLREHLDGEFPKGWFVFGSAYNKKNFTNATRGVKNPDYFKPSPIRVKRDTATKYWNEIVIDELKIDKYLYAAKKTGADDKILAGIPIPTLKELYGHSSELMTERYTSRLKEMRASELKKLSPEFIKKSE